MAIYDYNNTTSTPIKKVYDHNGTTSTPIKKVYDHNGTDSCLIYSGEETFIKTVTSGVTGRDENYGEFGVLNINLNAGETFRIDNVSFGQRIYTNVDCDLYVNGVEVWDYNKTVGDNPTINSGVIGTFTAESGKVSIMLRIRGWDSNASWNGTFTNTATITYTTGV